MLVGVDVRPLLLIVSSMLHTLAVAGYRSLQQLVLPLGQLNLITGPNGSGKSSIYRALRLLAETARGQLIQSLAREGGLQSTLWAGPEVLTREMQTGQIPVQGQLRKKPVSLRLGFTSDAFSYTIDLGLPVPFGSLFDRDPVIKRECLWQGYRMQPSTLTTDRRGSTLRNRNASGKWEDVDIQLPNHASMLAEYVDPHNAPELVLLRDLIRSWRFYDHIRTDADAPARRAEVGTYTPVMAGDGSDLAAALQTIRETGGGADLDEAVADAFPGSELEIQQYDGRLSLGLRQPGMLRPLGAAELSDGTLRYLLLVAALLTPRPPSLMVLNEPETSLHPDLLPALARLIARYAEQQQLIVVSHARPLIEELQVCDQCIHHQLEKVFGATALAGVDRWDLPTWKWPPR